jgi:flagellar biosynthesis protein
MMDKHQKKKKSAVALRYHPDKEHAPRVIAKGDGRLAEKIIQMARDHGIPVKNDPVLVETLSRMQVSEEIPPEAYVLVAELLAFVFGLGRKDNTG